MLSSSCPWHPKPHAQCWHFHVLTCGRSKLSPTLIILHEFSNTRGWGRGSLGSHAQLFYFGVSSNLLFSLPLLLLVSPTPCHLCLCLGGTGKLPKCEAIPPPCCYNGIDQPSHPSQWNWSPKSPFYERICSENLYTWVLEPDQVTSKTRCPGEGSRYVWKERNFVRFKQQHVQRA